MTASLLPTLAELGFLRVARFCTRAEHKDATRRRRAGDDGLRIAYLVDDSAAAAALWAGTKPVTYMWVREGESRPVYVGKATYGMAARAKQHEGGFHGTSDQRRRQASLASDGPGGVTAGLAHARRIRKGWEDPAGRKELELWVRPADVATMFGRQGSLVSAEEEVLIELFNPPWNTAKRQKEKELE